MSEDFKLGSVGLARRLDVIPRSLSQDKPSRHTIWLLVGLP
jgi:hypothetical protein